MHSMKFYFGNAIIACICLTALFCGTIPSNQDTLTNATLDLRIWVTKAYTPHEYTKTKEITWNKLVVIVSADDMDTVRDTFDIAMAQQYTVGTITGIPPGDNRLVTAWTLNDSNIIVHEGSVSNITLTSGEIETIPLTLFPICGSIYINLAKLPDDVEVVTASFRWDDDTVSVAENKSGLMYLSLDYIPDSTFGTLTVSGLNAADSVLYSDSVSFTYYVNRDTTISIQFIADPSGLNMEVTVIKSGVTLISGFMGSSTLTGPETGPLYISEIMYYAVGDSDYIEIHNPMSNTVTINELLLEVVSTSTISRKTFYNVSIPANDFFVIGDSDAPSDWTDTTVTLDLPTTGRWIILRNAADSSIIDWISYMGSGQDWPEKANNYAIVLDSLTTDVTYNNYGKNWLKAITEIDTSHHYGTPGQSGS